METWIFADWNPLNKKELKAIKYMMPTDVVLGVGGVGKGKHNFPFMFTGEFTMIESNVNSLLALGIDVHLMVWLRKNKQFITDCCNKFSDLINKIETPEKKLKSALLDAEGAFLKGTYPISIASEDLKRNLIDRVDVPVGLTSLAKLPPQLIQLLKHCAYGIPQAYACYKPKPKMNFHHFTHSKNFRPKVLHKIAYDSWSPHTVDVGKDMIMGQAFYWLKQPGYTELQALYASHNEAIRYKVKGEAYWSLKHGDDLGGSEQDRMDFIRALAI